MVEQVEARRGILRVKKEHDTWHAEEVLEI
jgi:hypothetical protein